MVGGEKVLVCRECSREFKFSQLEQEFYAQKGFTDPARCPDCRKSRRKVLEVRTCSKCNLELATAQPVYCNRCLENTRLELELKLRALERELSAAKAAEESARGSRSQLEQALSEKEAQTSTVGKELEEVRVSNEELRTQFQQSKAGELALTRSVQERDDRIGGLTRELEDTRRELDDSKLRLELAHVSLKNARLAAENEALRSLEGTITNLERRVSQLETQRQERDSTVCPGKTASSASEKRGLTGKLRGWLRFGHRHS